MTNLDIYFSDACNANCEYCIMQDLEHNNNLAIRQALEDNTFVTKVRNILIPEVKSIGFWGREPSVNGKYFGKFITNILDFDPYIRYIIIPTNGLTDSFYKDFIVPLLQYCLTHKRKLILMIQFSLDGPPEIHDKYYGQGSCQTCITNIKKICRMFPFDNKYLKLRMSTKSTLRGYELENYSPYIWYTYMLDLARSTEVFFKDYTDCKIGQLITTFEVPGNYTVSQGQSLANWRKYLRFNESLYHSCAAGTDSKTIDYLGNLYDCHLLVNKNITQEELRTQFEITMDTLVAANEAIEQDRDKLFNAISSIYCWGATDKRLDSYIRLLGNGFLL